MINLSKILNKLNHNPVAIAIVVVMLFVPTGYIMWKIHLRETHARYTVGLTLGSAGGGYIKYEYYVRSQRFESEQKTDKHDPIKNGGRYYLIFHAEDPENEEILWDRPVPSTVQTIPPEGWEKIPGRM